MIIFIYINWDSVTRGLPVWFLKLVCSFVLPISSWRRRGWCKDLKQSFSNNALAVLNQYGMTCKMIPFSRMDYIADMQYIRRTNRDYHAIKMVPIPNQEVYISIVIIYYKWMTPFFISVKMKLIKKCQKFRNGTTLIRYLCWGLAIYTLLYWNPCYALWTGSSYGLQMRKFIFYLSSNDITNLKFCDNFSSF